MAYEPSIPTVDLAELAGPDPTARSRAEAALREGFGECGLVYVRTHGVSDIGALYDRFLAFTARSAEDKERFNRENAAYLAAAAAGGGVAPAVAPARLAGKAAKKK